MDIHGWIIYNGQLGGDKFIDFANWLQNAATRKQITTTIYRNDELMAHFNHHSLDLFEMNHTERKPDFVLFTDKDIYLARQLELLGIPVFNSARTIEMSDDKIATYQALAAHQLPIPETIVKPKTFQQTENTPLYIDHILEEIPLPLIIKEAFGSFGEQVYLIRTKHEMVEKMKELAEKPYVFQAFIASSYGKDARLHVVGDKVVASMKRHNPDDFRSNVTTGGSMDAYTPTENESNYAVNAAKAIGADFAGIDFLFGPNNDPIVCEVNSNAHIHNMYDATGINVADDIIDYILTKQIDKWSDNR